MLAVAAALVAAQLDLRALFDIPEGREFVGTIHYGGSAPIGASCRVGTACVVNVGPGDVVTITYGNVTRTFGSTQQ